MGAARIVDKRLGRAVVNGCCDKPHAYMRDDVWRFRSHHDHSTHPLDLTAEDLRRMADELEKAGGTTWRV